jgi:small subunit ribosomal protein S1
MKQLQPHPWDAVAAKFSAGQRVRGTVTRVVEFGAFVELEPGVEGLIHVSEMSWGKKIRIASDVVKPGEVVDAVILGINPTERKISLGLKQALGDPWADVVKNVTVGSVIEGPVSNLTKFGAFVQVAEGVEGMVHISDLSAEKRLNHPADMLRVGQVVKAQVLAIDRDKRQLRLGMKQLVPSGLDEYIAEHKDGDIVTGRLMDTSRSEARVELGEGIHGTCNLQAKPSATSEETSSSSVADVASLSSMLKARWKSGPASGVSKEEQTRTGQIRSFRITKLDPASKRIHLELA